MSDAKKPRGWPFRTKAEERAWCVKNMLTVQKLIDYLKTCDPNALVCYFETNVGEWQAQSPHALGWLVRTVAAERRETRKNDIRRFGSKEKLEEWLASSLRDLKPQDVLIRF